MGIVVEVGNVGEENHSSGHYVSVVSACGVADIIVNKEQLSTPALQPLPQKPNYLRRKWSKKEQNEIFEQTKGTCYLCSRALEFSHRKKGMAGAWHIEHVVPLSRGGKDTQGNLLPACLECNLAVKKTKGILTLVVQLLTLCVFTAVEKRKYIVPSIMARAGCITHC